MNNHGPNHHHDHDHSDSQVGFDERAATWDDQANIARSHDIAEAIAAAVAPSASTSLFEYGAGTGLVTQALGDRVGPALLADASAGMREVIQTKIDDGRLPRAKVTDVDLADPHAQLPQSRFDLIVTVLTLHHIAEMDLVLRRFAQLLAPGGHLCIVDLDAEDGSFHGDGFGGHHGFERPALSRQLAAAGFDQVAIGDCGVLDRDGTPYSMFLAVGSTTTAKENPQ